MTDKVVHSYSIKPEDAVNTALVRALKQYARRNGTTMSHIVLEALSMYSNTLTLESQIKGKNETK